MAELPQVAAAGRGGPERACTRITQTWKVHAADLDAGGRRNPDGRDDGEPSRVERTRSPCGRDREQALRQLAGPVRAHLRTGVTQRRVGESPEAVVGERRRLQGVRELGHLERVVHEAAHEVGDDGIGHGAGDRVVAREEAGVGNRRVWAVEEPQLASLERCNVGDEFRADLSQRCQRIDGSDDPGAVAFGADRAPVDQTETGGDVLPVEFGGSRHHAIHDRTGEWNLVGDPFRQRRIDRVGAVQDPRPQDVPVVLQVVERREDRWRQSGPTATGQGKRDERRRGGGALRWRLAICVDVVALLRDRQRDERCRRSCHRPERGGRPRLH